MLRKGQLLIKELSKESNDPRSIVQRVFYMSDNEFNKITSHNEGKKPSNMN